MGNEVVVRLLCGAALKTLFHSEVLAELFAFLDGLRQFFEQGLRKP